jgi:phenylpyruvate tautomerase PptA (4-oxalocrotonate tautomerase family)
MPFIESKITVKLTEEKKENIKSRLGEAVSILGKSETYLMVGFEDGYSLYMGGRKLEKGAYVSVRVFGKASSDACDRFTGEVCRILESELEIPGKNVYVSYWGTQDWGWNGNNF